MKQQQKLIATLLWAVTLSGLLSAASANAGEAPDEVQPRLVAPSTVSASDDAQVRSDQRQSEVRESLRLSLEQLDEVYGGMISNDSPTPTPPYGSDGRGVTCRHTSCAGL
jgi:hypothetical protein